MKFCDIDQFASKADEKHTRTSLGGLLTLLAPVGMAYFAYLTYLAALDTPFTETVQSMAADAALFEAEFMCVVEGGGCMFTVNYVEDSPCRTKISKSGSGAFKSLFDKCNVMPNHNDATKAVSERYVRIPFCYSAHPDEGINFFWSRNSSCSQPGSQCKFGIQLYQRFFDRLGESWKETSVALYSGVHVMSINELQETVTNTTGVTGLLLSSVHVSSESKIVKLSDSGYSDCCSASSIGPKGCADGASPGTANDKTLGDGTIIPGTHYQAKIRTFPTFNKVTIAPRSPYIAVLTAIGAFLNIYFIVCKGVVIFYRFISGTNQLKDIESRNSLHHSRDLGPQGLPPPAVFPIKPQKEGKRESSNPPRYSSPTKNTAELY